MSLDGSIIWKVTCKDFQGVILLLNRAFCQFVKLSVTGCGAGSSLHLFEVSCFMLSNWLLWDGMWMNVTMIAFSYDWNSPKNNDFVNPLLFHKRCAVLRLILCQFCYLCEHE